MSDWKDFDPDDFPKAKSKGPRKESKRLLRERRQPSNEHLQGPYRVVMVTRGACEVELEDGSRLRAVVSRHFQEPFGEEPVCGDLAWIGRRPDGTPFLGAIDIRKSGLYRAERSSPGGRRLLLANLDIVGIVVTVKEPPWLPGWVERCVIAAVAGNIEPILIFQKTDLFACPEQEFAPWVAPYREAGIPVVLTSARSGNGLSELQNLLRGKLTAFVGQSGVGKSSLLERLVPGAKVKIGELSAAHRTGTHTTTRAELFRTPDGLALIDTPGIRSLDLSHLRIPEIAQGFPDFWKLRGACRFRDCTHRSEPGCAVVSLRESGQLREQRYQIYLRLLESATT
jgi:ribosome biogenesis GTPase